MTEKEKYSEISMNIDSLDSYGKETKMSLEYYLIESVYNDEDTPGAQLKTYGVEVVKREYAGDEIYTTESKAAEHISVSRQKVENLLKDISKNTVTPITLYSILDNMLGAGY